MTFDREHGRTLLVYCASLVGEAIDDETVEKVLDGYEATVHERLVEVPVIVPGNQNQLKVQCGRTMIGSGDDTYDPVCELRDDHEGPCRSSAAIDQHRLYPGCHVYGAPDDGVRYCQRCGICENSGIACSGVRGVPGAQPKARHTDPQTAKAAAQRQTTRRLSQPRRLLVEMSNQWWAPKTAEQLAEATGMPINSASTRMSELVKAGLVEERGTRRTRNGAPAVTYAITSDGIAAAQSLEGVADDG